MPQVEDFGIAAVEAMAEGTPVLAFRGGGALETVKEGATGEFFDDLDAYALADGIRRIRDGIAHSIYDRMHILDHARQFSEDKFRSAMRNAILG